MSVRGRLDVWRTRLNSAHAPSDDRATAPTTPRARTARILMVDVEDEMPPLQAEVSFDDVWLILSYHHVPCAIVVLDLSADAAANEARARAECAKILAAHCNDPAPAPHTTPLPRISVVVPTLASNIEGLSRCIDSLAQLEYPDFEVLLIDNRRALPEDDPLVALTNDQEWLRVIRESRPGISAARNRGIIESHADLIAFTDDDVRVDRHWLRAIALRFAQEPALDVVTGLVLPGELSSTAQIWYEKYFGGFGGVRSFRRVTVRLARGRTRRWRLGLLEELDAATHAVRTTSLYGAGRYVAGANMAFKRSALEQIRGFDVTLGTGTSSRGGEDLAAVISVLWGGGTIGFEPGAYVFHRHRRTYAQLLDQLDGSGIGFTAMLTSLVRRDPRHLLAMLCQVPSAGARLARLSLRRARGQRIIDDGSTITSNGRAYPARLISHELIAYFHGPFAYRRSVIDARRNQGP